MTAHHVTRRTALGAGLALLSVAKFFHVKAYGQTMQSAHHPYAIDAMLIDGGIEMPAFVDAIIQSRAETMAVMKIHLDAAGHGELRRVLSESQTIVGMSSGATLFCLERIAWDHGFRLTTRHQWSADALSSEAYREDIAKFLSAAHIVATSSLPRAYRPSRADGTMHAWTIQKSIRSQFRRDRQEA